MLTIEWAGEQLKLLPEKAILWPAARIILVADPHFGKPSAFRRAGIPVPRGTTDSDIARLSELIRVHSPEQLLVLGDFFHTRMDDNDDTLNALREWRQDHASLAIGLTAGNHDRHALHYAHDLGLKLHDPCMPVGPFHFCHDPEKVTQPYTFSGHLHPCISLRDGAGSRLRAPCFLFRALTKVAVLPSFGSFTGSFEIEPHPGDRVVLIGDGELFELRC